MKKFLLKAQDNQLIFSDIGTIRWFIKFCIEYFNEAYVHKIYILGSRASGVNSIGKEVRADSDHDFYLVLNDNVTFEIHTGSSEWFRFFNEMTISRVAAGIGPIDVFVCRSTDFYHSVQDPNSPASKAVKGILLI